MPRWFWKAIVLVGGTALLIALFVLGLNLAVVAGRAAVAYTFDTLFSHTWWQ